MSKKCACWPINFYAPNHKEYFKRIIFTNILLSFIYEKYTLFIDYVRLIGSYLSIFLLVWSFSSHSKIFHWNRDVIITGEGLQILTYARPLSSKSSLACHTYCDKGHPFIMVISEDLWHSQFWWAFNNRAITTCFNVLGMITFN